MARAAAQVREGQSARAGGGLTVPWWGRTFRAGTRLRSLRSGEEVGEVLAAIWRALAAAVAKGVARQLVGAQAAPVSGGAGNIALDSPPTDSVALGPPMPVPPVPPLLQLV